MPTAICTALGALPSCKLWPTGKHISHLAKDEDKELELLATYSFVPWAQVSPFGCMLGQVAT